jgi:hypothetical protein
MFGVFENNKIISFNKVLVIASKFLKVYMKIRWYSLGNVFMANQCPLMLYQIHLQAFAHGLVSDLYIHMQIVLPR